MQVRSPARAVHHADRPRRPEAQGRRTRPSWSCWSCWHGPAWLSRGWWRTEGGIRLAELIRAGHAQHPDARHFIVAHSHGGNVALYAIRNPVIRLVIDGIVTLATPFLSARPRDPHGHAEVMAWLTLTVTALWAFVVLDALALPAVTFWWLLAAAFLRSSTDWPNGIYVRRLATAWHCRERSHGPSAQRDLQPPCHRLGDQRVVRRRVAAASR